MVLFSYYRIYRDQTLSARITRGMFVASYKIFQSIQSRKQMFLPMFLCFYAKQKGQFFLSSVIFDARILQKVCGL